MKTFVEWLKENEEEFYSEIDWQRMAKNATLATGLLAGSAGIAHGGGLRDLPMGPEGQTFSVAPQSSLAQKERDARYAAQKKEDERIQ